MKAQDLTDKQFKEEIKRLVDAGIFVISNEDSPCNTPISTCKNCMFSYYTNQGEHGCDYMSHEKRIIKFFPEYFI